MTDPIVQRLLSFLDDSPTSYHAAFNVYERLVEAGFHPFDLKDAPTPFVAGEGYVTLNDGAVIAFRMGTRSPVEGGFHLFAAHTDSPNLRIKPSPLINTHGYLRLGVEVYGGALVATWADRDLGLAGMIRTKNGENHRVLIRRPICRIPNLAIHLNRGVNDTGLSLNKHSQLPALFALQGGEDAPFKAMLAAHTGLSPDSLLTWDLALFDLQRATIGGTNKEFVFSARLDNLASCHAGIEGLIQALDHDPGEATVGIALFDHEEVGSRSSTGAAGQLWQSILQRVVNHCSLQAAGGLGRAIAHSTLLSCDMAHAIHPSFSDKSDLLHAPLINQGPAIKVNANQRYGTDHNGSALFIALCERAKVPHQWFVNRSDLACGSTVGPAIAAQLGIHTVDIGNPMLSMHSIREMCGTSDHVHLVAILTEWFKG